MLLGSCEGVCPPPPAPVQAMGGHWGAGRRSQGAGSHRGTEAYRCWVSWRESGWNGGEHKPAGQGNAAAGRALGTCSVTPGGASLRGFPVEGAGGGRQGAGKSGGTGTHRGFRGCTGGDRGRVIAKGAGVGGLGAEWRLAAVVGRRSEPGKGSRWRPPGGIRKRGSCLCRSQVTWAWSLADLHQEPHLALPWRMHWKREAGDSEVRQEGRLRS